MWNAYLATRTSETPVIIMYSKFKQHRKLNFFQLNTNISCSMTTLNDSRGLIPRRMKAITKFNKRHSFTEPRTDLYNSKRAKEDACQAGRLTLIHWNKSWTVRTTVLKWVVTKPHTWSDNKFRELIVVKVLYTSLLNTTMVAFKVPHLESYAPMPAPSPPFKTILELVLWNSLQNCHCITPDVINVTKMPAFQYFLYLGEQKNVTGG